MPIEKYTVVFYTISHKPEEGQYNTDEYSRALYVANRKAEEGFLPVYIVDNELEEVVLDV